MLSAWARASLPVALAACLALAAAGCCLQRTGLGPPDAGADEGVGETPEAPDVPQDAGCTADPQCDDGVACTIDSCNTATGVCLYAPMDGLCGPMEHCDVVSGCLPAACTTDAQCDNGLPCDGRETCTTGACRGGTPLNCNDGCPATFDSCVNSVPGGCVHLPSGEICNGIDDDCNGMVDDGFPCIQNTTVACTTTCGTAGTGTCSPTCTLPSGPACNPPAEICNGRDDNCDTVCDDGFACCQGIPLSCTTTCGSTGTGTCTATCSLPAPADCTPPAETCNGADDDCDGRADNGFACVRGATTTCTTTCGSTGSGTCTAGCATPPPASCTPPIETCNGRDDDCDGLCDDPFVCCRGATMPCAVCNRAATETCGLSCTWGSCVGTEICNLCDDDANGLADTGFLGAGFVNLLAGTMTSTEPSIAFDSVDRQYAIVWTEGGSIHFNTRRAVDGTSAANRTLSLGTSTNPTHPRIAWVGRPPAATFFVVWEDHSNAWAEVMGAPLALDGTAGGTFQISVTPGGTPASQYQPDVASNGTTVVAVWTDTNTALSTIHAAQIDPVTPAILASDRTLPLSPVGNLSLPAIATDGLGYAVVWTDDRGAALTARVGFITVDASAVATSTAQFVPAPTTADRTAWEPDVAWSGPEGGSVWGVVYRYGNAATTTPDILFVPFTATATPTPGSILTLSSGIDIDLPRIAGGGTFWAFAWNDKSVGSGDIEFAWYDALATPPSAYAPVQNLTSDAATSQTPEIVWGGGEYGIAWIDFGVGGDNGDAFFDHMLCMLR